jgi:hypothetical protein
MTCSFCAKRISYFRSFVDSQFCSAEHRQQEAERLRTLALERLMQNTRDIQPQMIAKTSSSGLLARSA